MIKITKRNGNKIIKKEYENENDFKNEKPCYLGVEKINDINFSKSYSKEVYCKKICGKCYYYGCDWDIRCSKNNKPINQVVHDCEIFQNAKKLYSEMIKKMLNDDGFFVVILFIKNIKQWIILINC